MIRYIVRRLLLLIPVLLGMTLITFSVTKAIPVNPVIASISQTAADHPEIVAAYRKEWGLDKPFLVQYLIYVRNLLHGNLGVSIYTHRPVVDDLRTYLPATIELATTTIIFSVVVSVPLGILAATRRGGAIDLIVRILTLMGVAMPIFWLALLLLDVFYLHLGWAPDPGRLSYSLTPPPTLTGLYVVDALIAGEPGIAWNALCHLALPSLVLATWSAGLLTRMTRASMLTVLPQDFLRNVRSKGASNFYVIRKHAAPNATIPVITVVGLAYGDLLSGALVVETIFGWPGIGLYAYNAAIHADFPAMTGVTLVVGFIYTLLNLVIDIIYALIDPRVRASLTVAA
ncbi:MAG TPA: ABC transporter permease [Acetobacteraceae bacterium]|nr:ABC transporter permease [Acetobacteraceae bacterium]